MNFLQKDLTKVPREEQNQALNFFIDNLKKSETKFFMFDLPTGIGKSVLSLMLMQYYKNNFNKNAKFDMIVSSKILQEQYHEFPSITSLWGRDNYECEEYGVDCSEGKKFCQINKTKCENCPYDSKKNNYLSGDVSLTNYHLYILFQIYQQDLAKTRGSNVLIVDEAHLLESTFSDFISINLNEFFIKKSKFSKGDDIIKQLKRINDLTDFVDFCEKYLFSKINQTKGELQSELIGVSPIALKRDAKLGKVSNKGTDKYKTLELIAELEQFKSKVENFIKDYKESPDNWVMEKNINKNGNADISVMPVWSSSYLDRYIWSKYDHVILMSGTILNKDLFSFINGIDPNKSCYLRMDSPFDIKNRPIYYMPLGKMTYTSKVETFKNFKPFIGKLMNKYKGKKGIIHTVNYEIANWVKDSIKDDRFIFHDADSKDYALRKHYMDESTETVIVSPSMSTGVNFEGDRARFQILLKVPYPFLGSEKNKLRQKLRPDWYTWLTVSSILQSYGRGFRSYDDTCDFIILDGCFGDVMKYSSDWIPPWVWNAIKRVNIKIEN